MRILTITHATHGDHLVIIILHHPNQISSPSPIQPPHLPKLQNGNRDTNRENHCVVSIASDLGIDPVSVDIIVIAKKGRPKLVADSIGGYFGQTDGKPSPNEPPKMT
ncbi:hypothetical protein LXL04_014305 [Taraxacum kok-saghyz]